MASEPSSGRRAGPLAYVAHFGPFELELVMATLANGLDALKGADREAGFRLLERLRCLRDATKPPSGPEPVSALYARWREQQRRVVGPGSDDELDDELLALFEIEAEIVATPAATPRGLLAKLELLEREVRCNCCGDREPDDIERLTLSAIADGKRLFAS